MTTKLSLQFATGDTTCTFNNADTYFAKWYQNTVEDLHGTDTNAMPNAVSDSADARITYAAGVFTCTEEGNYRVQWQTNPSTCEHKVLISIAINGAKRHGVYNFYDGTTTKSAPTMILSQIYYIAANSTIEILSSTVVAGDVFTSGADDNGNSTTTMTIARLGAGN